MTSTDGHDQTGSSERTQLSNQVDRRRFLRAITTAAGAAFLTACGSPPSAATSGTTSTAASAAASTTAASTAAGTSTASSASITLTMMDYYQAPSDGAVQTLISDYQAANPGIRIERSYVPFGEMQSKVLQGAAANTLPDIVLLDNPQVASFADAGVLTDLGQYTQGWTQLDDYFKSALATATWKDKLYGIPVGNNNLALFYNETMLNEAGLKPPQTWEELRTAAKQLTKDSRYGLAVSSGPNDGATWNFLPFFWGNNADLLKVNAPESVEALTLWSQLLQDGSVSKNILAPDFDVTGQFVAGNAAMMVNGPWTIPALQKTPDLKFGITYVPRKEASMAPSSPLGGEVWTLPRSTPERQQAAWDFVKWTQDPERIIKLCTINNYLPAYQPAGETVVAQNPLLKTFSEILPTAKARADVLGPQYPQASEALWKAIQSVMTGQQTPQEALDAAQAKIDTLVR